MLETSTFDNPNYLLANILVDSLPFKKGAEGELVSEIQLLSSDGRRFAWPLYRAKRPDPLRPSDLIYLIMPDRFANGDKSNDIVAGMQQKEIDRSKFLFRHGGDLEGVRQNLDYIKDLGVTALWLNPVLENDQPYESYHGYAVTDHYEVDARFGGNDAYFRLVGEAHEKGIKVLMDLVPNHAGDQHFLYTDMPDRSWWHLPDAFQRSNFRIPSVLDPHASEADRKQMLEGWFDHHMPDFNQDSDAVKRYFTQLAIWWVAFSGHDGYRVDTYPYSDPDFMAAWSNELKVNFPDLSFFGEVWVDGLPHQAAFVPGVKAPVDAGANPSVTDFQLYGALHESLHQEQSWVGGVAKLWLTLTQDWMYADPNAQITFLDNHDLSRLATSMNGDETKIKSAISLLLTLRGTPMLYYGTEIGIQGSGGGFGEGGRKDMPGGFGESTANAFTGEGLSAFQQNLLNHVRRLGQYRRDHPDMATGQMTQYVPVDGLYVFSRKGKQNHRWLVVFNAKNSRSNPSMERFSAEWQNAKQAVDLINGQKHSLPFDKLSLEPWETKIFELQQ